MVKVKIIMNHCDVKDFIFTQNNNLISMNEANPTVADQYPRSTMAPMATMAILL